MRKATGLAEFTRNKYAATPYRTEANVTTVRKRVRGNGEKVALTVRLPRTEWERVHQLAVSEGVSIQALAVEGLSKIFIEKGLPGLME